MQVDELLARLSKVKKTGPGKWMARCPAHEDGSPSLAIKEQDGVILLHCFAECSTDDVCGAVGIELADLFPPSDKREWVGTEKPVRFGTVKFGAIDALRCLSHEVGLMAIYAADMADGRVLGPEERDRLSLMCLRITTALDYIESN